jgi:hypothetical protein
MEGNVFFFACCGYAATSKEHIGMVFADKQRVLPMAAQKVSISLVVAALPPQPTKETSTSALPQAK